jgi:transposase
MLIMPTAYGAESRQDVIDVPRTGRGAFSADCEGFRALSHHAEALDRHAERKDSGAVPAATESAEMRELKKRNRLLEQENEILRRAAAYLARDINPK